LEAAMQEIHADMDAFYGKRRMLIELQAMGYQDRYITNIYNVSSLMKNLKLVAKCPQ